MVRFRGIEISIISQFDIHSLPEFRCRQDGQHQSATVSCYVPIYAGSQIWLEYRIDGPHPPKAAYFFKVLFNGRVITSFGCGPENDYHGKMMYNLVALGQGRDNQGLGLAGRPIVRQALRFRSKIDDDDDDDDEEEHEHGPGRREDVIEVRVHRVDRRKRIRQLQDDQAMATSIQSCPHDTLQLADGGPLEPGFPRRRYRFQLLDAVDEPWATFKFFCRSHEHLRSHGILDSPRITDSLAPSHASSAYSEKEQDAAAVDDRAESRDMTMKPKSKDSAASLAAKRDSSFSMADEQRSVLSGTHLPPSDSDGDLSILTKDSIEDLPSTVPRSPRSPTKEEKEEEEASLTTGPAPADQARASPRRRRKTGLTLNLNGADFDLETENRPLRPFTRGGGGIFRKLVPPSAPAAVTEFGPTIQDEVDGGQAASSKREEILAARTTRAERGGKSLMGFLSRRVAAK